jgi:hypothetical protein
MFTMTPRQNPLPVGVSGSKALGRNFGPARLRTSPELRIGAASAALAAEPARLHAMTPFRHLDVGYRSVITLSFHPFDRAGASSMYKGVAA